MTLQDEEPDRHWMKWLCQQRMRSGEHFSQLDLVVITFAHFPAIDGNHIIVDPIFCRAVAIADRTLCNLAFMVRKLEIHAATMNVEFRAKVFGSHGRALDVPARVTFPPWASPPHNVFWCRRFPKREISLVSFFFLSI